MCTMKNCTVRVGVASELRIKQKSFLVCVCAWISIEYCKQGTFLVATCQSLQQEERAIKIPSLFIIIEYVWTQLSGQKPISNF